MGNINASVDFSTRDEGRIALIVMDNPPVNALKHELRAGLVAALAKAAADAAVQAVVLTGTGRFFSAGADITEFGQPRRSPSLIDVIAELDAMTKPVIAAVNGQALGGGCELALGCHWRLAAPSARLGLPEIKLGLLPGAGGTQRMPRLAGVARAVEIILSGNPVSAARALADGIVDAVPEGDLLEAALAFARQAVADRRPLRRARDVTDKIDTARADPKIFETAAAPFLRRARGEQAPQSCARAIRGAFELPFEEGQKQELALFLELLQGDQSRARRHVFFAEREAQKIPDMPAGIQPKPIARAVVVGAGTMGGGIAMCFANVGIPVTILETEQAALDRGMARIADNYRTTIARGNLTQPEMDKRMAALTPSLDFARIAEGDIVIEAVFEEMGLKQKVFADLDRLAKPGALLATNTSTLDVDVIARSTGRPADVVGMHFFSPANVMKLLEVVRGKATSHEALATAMAVGKRIGKIVAVSGVCDGFIGNRMLARRSTESERLLLEGALPQDVDAVVYDFGFPMGPFAMGDLAGLDVGWRIRKGRGITAAVSDALCEAGRFGQKTGAGYYRYDGRTPTPDPEVERIILQAAARAGIARRTISREEILERMIYPMINEGARILDEGIAMRPGDIDVVWIYGYGWPAWRGGPMWYADSVGLRVIRDRLAVYAERSGDASLRPAPLLERLVAEGRDFASLATGKAGT